MELNAVIFSQVLSIEKSSIKSISCSILTTQLSSKYLNVFIIAASSFFKGIMAEIFYIIYTSDFDIKFDDSINF